MGVESDGGWGSPSRKQARRLRYNGGLRAHPTTTKIKALQAILNLDQIYFYERRILCVYLI